MHIVRLGGPDIGRRPSPDMKLLADYVDCMLLDGFVLRSRMPLGWSYRSWAADLVDGIERVFHFGAVQRKGESSRAATYLPMAVRSRGRRRLCRLTSLHVSLTAIVRQCERSSPTARAEPSRRTYQKRPSADTIRPSVLPSNHCGPPPTLSERRNRPSRRRPGMEPGSPRTRKVDTCMFGRHGF